MFDPKALNLIRDRAGWDAARVEFGRMHGWDEDHVQWGDGPAVFPALVAFSSPAAFRVVACYVYPGQAAALLEAAGYAVMRPVGPFTVPDDSEQGRAITQLAAGKAVAGTPLKFDFDPSEQQRGFNRHLAAQQMSIVQVLIDNKLVTQAAFEAKLSSNLAVVDRWHSADRDKLRGLVDGAAMLDGLYPPKE